MQILTADPEYDTRTWQQQSRIYGGYDSVDNGLAFSVRSRGGRSGLGIAGGASYQHHGSRRSGRGVKLRPSGYRSRAADLKFLLGRGERFSLVLSAQAMEQPSTPRYDELTAGFGQTEPSSRQFLFKPNRREFIHARLRLEGISAWFDEFEVHAARQVITDDRLSQAFLSPVVVTEMNRSTLDGLSLQVNSTLRSGTRLVWGAEYYSDDIDSHRFESSGDTSILTPVRSRFPDGAQMDSSALYASAEWPALEKLELSTGLRYSWFDIALPGTAEYAAVHLQPADLTGDVHAVYTVRPDIKLVANIGRGFRPPNIFDLATLGPRPGNRYNVANPNLGPETVISYDAGIKLEADETELELFAFRMDYADKITSVATGETTPGGRIVVRSENRSRAVIYGLETRLDWSPSARARAFMTLNYTHGKERDGGQVYPADRIPPLNGRLGLRYRLTDAWTIEPYTLFATRQDRLSPRDTRDPRIDPRGTPGWATINVGIHWQPAAGLELGLRLENLTDSAYREHASGIDAPGRNIGTWLNYRFP
jgi:outer membrane receptor protein involved in Fe transport